MALKPILNLTMRHLLQYTFNRIYSEDYVIFLVLFNSMMYLYFVLVSSKYIHLDSFLLVLSLQEN